MNLKKILFISCALCGMAACTHVNENQVTQPQTKVEPADSTEKETIAISGHLICTALHNFFVPDDDARELLRKTDWASEADDKHIMVSGPANPEPYFAFRSTYLPPVRSFMRVECADRVYEIDAAWDEVCPVRVKLLVDKKPGGDTDYTDYAPADKEFLQQLAEEYNRESLAGIYKGLAGTPTTEDMRGKAVAADAWFYCAEGTEIGPHTRRFIEEGERVLNAAYDKEKKTVSLQEREEVEALLRRVPYAVEDVHQAPWLEVDASGNVAKIVGTPYCLRFVQTDDVWKLYFEGTDGTRLEIPFREHHKLPFNPVYHQTTAAVTMLYLAPDKKGLVVDPYCRADHEEYPISHISWRDGTPRLEEPIRCTGVGCNHTGEVNEYFIGWKDNTPVTKYRVE